MQVVRALFDGRTIKPIDPISTKKKTEVLVIFPNDVKKIIPEKARKLLRGSGKGERLTERLLISRVQIHNGILVHKDPEFEEVASFINEHRLPYKLS